MAVIAPIVASAVVSLIGGVVKGAMQKSAQAKQQKANDQAEYETYLEVKAEVEESNRVATAEHAEAWGKMQAVALREGTAHLIDARAKAAEFSLLSQEYQIKAGQQAHSQVAAYGASGSLVRGSALERLYATQARGLEGADRLRREGEQELRRGRQLYHTTRYGVVEPALNLTELPVEVANPNAAAEEGQTEGQTEGDADQAKTGSVFDYKKETDAYGRPAYTEKGANPYYGMSKHGEERFRATQEKNKKKRAIEKMAAEQRSRGNTRGRERSRDEAFIKSTLPKPPSMAYKKPVVEDLDAIGLGSSGSFGY